MNAFFKPEDDLAQIRSIMERSTKFLSLSALSAILAGVYALVGAGLAYNIIYGSEVVLYFELKDQFITPEILPLILIAGAVFVLAVSTGLLLSYRKASAAGQALWNGPAKRLFYSFIIPFSAGAVFVVILYFRGHFSLLAASTLLFYGMALLNAGNFTFSDIRKLGMGEIALGVLAAIFPGKGLLFWALGFGVLHIVYGVIMYLKYERK
ncbi:MAG: hypothetical protein HUU01_04805 [Saprospiraceae bacterium]|nr:hypothetical protein [Saprospiraceae bacterium]